MKDTIKDYQVSYHHKDRLFRFIFKEKSALLSLYNAVNDSDYQDVQALQIYTMEDYVYMGMKNDLSFLIDWNLNVFEHQSTYNPNMPLRGFMYMAAAYRKYIELNRLDIYASRRLLLPVPRYYVFYNGSKEMTDEVLLRLTDNMQGTDAAEKSCAQFTAHMINVNAGHNTGIMKRCPLLYEYALFIAEIRRNLEKELALKDAIDQAVNACIRSGILSDILRANKAEVTDMLLTEYDEAFHISTEKEISFKEGQESERKNTESEKLRADTEMQRADTEMQRANTEKQRADAAQKQVALLQLRNNILTHKFHNKSNKEIADIEGVSEDVVQSVLASIMNEQE